MYIAKIIYHHAHGNELTSRYLLLPLRWIISSHEYCIDNYRPLICVVYNYLLKCAGAPSPVTSLNYSQVLVSSSKNMTQVPVNVSWDSPENAQEFMLQIMNTSYSTTVRSLESSVTVPLPYGTYSATLCAINRCGQECRDYSNIFRIEPQQPPQKPDEDNNSKSNYYYS